VRTLTAFGMSQHAQCKGEALDTTASLPDYCKNSTQAPNN